MFLHVFYSWLITQLIHPFLLIALDRMTGGSGDDFSSLHLSDVPLIAVVSGIVSLPCLLTGWLFLGIIMYLKHSTIIKFLLWLLTTAVLVILNYWMPVMIANDEIQFGYLLFTLPGIVSIWLASFIRIEQFFKLDRKQYAEVTDILEQ